MQSGAILCEGYLELADVTNVATDVGTRGGESGAEAAAEAAAGAISDAISDGISLEVRCEITSPLASTEQHTRVTHAATRGLGEEARLALRRFARELGAKGL